MPRGVRRSPLERLQQELTETQNAIQQYKDTLAELKDKEKEIQDKINLEGYKEVSDMLSEKNMSFEDLKDIVMKN